MKSKSTPDEQPKERVAKRVITAKRLYFIPEAGIEIEASSASEAVELHKKQLKAQKEHEVGDD